MTPYKVLITASGVGQRLGKLTQFTNKALVRIGKKPAISYIVESYPKDTPFVVTTGYFGDQVRDFLTLTYPDRSFEFVAVDHFVGQGSSLGYSMLQAADQLQCPFIYHASDTLVDATPPALDSNWIGVSKGNDSSQYAAWQVMGKNELIFRDKGALDFDFIHIGLVGIRDYEEFWNVLRKLYAQDPNNGSLNDCDTIVEMMKRGSVFSLSEFSVWRDIGNTAALQAARETVPDAFHNLDKYEEEIFLFDDFVVKFFFNEHILKRRAERARQLGSLVPNLQGERKNFYRYEFVQGDVYADVVNPHNFSQFLAWAKQNLWIPKHDIDPSQFQTVCREFYKDKTEKRVKTFLKESGTEDRTHIINEERVPPVLEMLQAVDFHWLTNAVPHRIHGDFILDNIIKTKEGFRLIDWRQDFGGLMEAGDMYYDFAKLNHSLTISHTLVNRDLFTVRTNEDGSVLCDILTKSVLNDCRTVLFDFLKKEGFDVQKVRLLTAIIWLNMSPLHHHPFNHFLFYYGKYHMYRELKSMGRIV